MALQLFYGAGSCAFAALASLEHAGATYEPIKLDLAAGDQRSEQYLALNPLGRVPVLIVNGTPVTELIAVLTYIANHYPAAQLLPHDHLALAKAYEMLSWFSTGFHGYIAQILRGERFSDDTDVRERLKEPARRHFAEQLARLDRACAGREAGIVSDSFTVVDAFSIVIWRWAEKLGIDTTNMAYWPMLVARHTNLPAVRRAFDIEAGTQRWLPEAMENGVAG